MITNLENDIIYLSSSFGKCVSLHICLIPRITILNRKKLIFFIDRRQLTDMS